MKGPLLPIGFRGAILAAFGSLDLVYGGSLVWATPETRATALNRYVAEIAPLAAWGSAWVVIGVVCIVYAPRREDWPAYAAAQLIEATWGLLALAGWLTGQVSRGYVSAAVWMFAAAIVAVCSRWPEPPEPPTGRG